MNATDHRAVFLSYASQDAEAAKRICEALRQAGVEVWFDQSELVGGDQWDAKIRGQIGSCALFVPIISANTQARREGYFRIEWKLAAQRTHAMADGTPFLLPILIDSTRDAEALAPAEFKSVQWTKLPSGDTPPAFVAQVKKLLAGDVGRNHLIPPQDATAGYGDPALQKKRPRWLAPVLAGGVIAALALVFARPWEKAAPTPITAAPPALDQTKGLSEARKLTAQARALIDDDLMAGRENFRLADELGQRATVLDPTDGEVWALQARVLMGILERNYDSSPQRREQTRMAVERANRLAPRAVESGLALSAYQLFSRQNADAEQTARETLRLFPNDQRCLRQLAEICRMGNKLAEAYTLLHRAEALPGGDVRALVMESVYLRDEGRLVEAEAAVDRSLALAPSYHGYQMKLLLVAIDWGELDRALPLVEQLPARLQQEDVFAGLTAKYWLWREQPDRALEILRRVPRDFFEEARQYFPKGWLTGWAMRMAGRPAAAQAEWEQALAVVDKRLVAEPNRRELVVYRARLLALLGHRTEAETALRLAVELEGNVRSNASGTEAAVRVCLGDNEAAIQSLLELLKDRSRLLDKGAGNSFKREPMWAPIRSDPRIQELISDGEEQLRRLKAPAAGTSEIADAKSVAVLAFANLSDDKANEYFSDGISEELLNVLAKVPGLKVTARTSSFHFKGKDTPIREIAQQLGVAYVIEGSVRKSGDKVRITAQLIKAADGFHVWSDTFTRDLKDIFAVQDEIAGLIAQQLQLKLGETARVARTVNPEAHQLYLRAQAQWKLRTTEGYQQSESLLRQALSLDPEFAPAYALLTYVGLVRSDWATDFDAQGQPSPRIQTAQAYASRAMQLDPQSPEAHVALGGVLGILRRWAEAEREFRQAIALNPNHATAHQWLARLLEIGGRMDEAITTIRQATELDPLSARIADNQAMILFHAGQTSAALAAIEKALLLQPDSRQALFIKGEILLGTGQRIEARTLVAGLVTQTLAGETIDAANSSLFRVLSGIDDPVKVAIIAERIAGWSLVPRVLCALQLGRRDEALALLEPNALSYWETNELLWNKAFDPIRASPQFTTLLQKTGLTEAHARTQAWRQAHRVEKSPGNN